MSHDDKRKRPFVLIFLVDSLADILILLIVLSCRYYEFVDEFVGKVIVIDPCYNLIRPVIT